MKDQDFKKIFTEQKIDVPDEGFSEHVIRQLPERRSRLPQIIMGVFIMIGLALMFVIQDVTPLLKQIDSLIAAINQQQMPSLTSVVTYLCLLATCGIIGYSIAGTE
ncbi:MAG: DUF5056 domain-containing protein [Tannerella sp.]|jgi:hypothetical protein|nr:DUF5056 domain-containing protein [Tannerella sp.]